MGWKARLAPLGRLLRLRGWRDRGLWLRSALLLALCGLVALLMMDHVRVPDQPFAVGDVATYNLPAPVSFAYTDWDHTGELRREAREAVPPVFEVDISLGARLESRVALAFDAARRKLQAEPQEGGPSRGGGPESREEIVSEFLAALDLAVDEDHVRALLAAGFDPDIEALTSEFIGVTMRRQITERAAIPQGTRSITVIRVTAEGRKEVLLESFDDVVTIEQARQDLQLYALEHDPADISPEAERAAQAIARAAVRANMTPRPDLTERRQTEAADGVPPVQLQVKQGTVLFRAGDVLTQRHIVMLAGLREVSGNTNALALLLSLLAFSTIVISTFYLYGANYVRHFTTRLRDLEALAVLLLLVLALARVTVHVGAGFAASPGYGPVPGSVWYIVPVAGGAMLARILANGETALLFAVLASLLCGVLMDHQVYYALFFLVSALAAAGGVAHAKERAHVLRAGLQTAVVNSAVALLIDLLRLHQGDAHGLSLETVGWDMTFAATGGVISAVLVLGLTPLFEMFGFVTEYKLLELANLNHPLLRQLMLRAPGTYHHSVIVGSLSEAGCEAIGADKLVVRVAAYFHDIGKIAKPQNFVENQRDVPNPHDRLPPRKSANLIIRHVSAGQRIAAHHRLPQPIIDNIAMHHGTGLVRYFLEKARRQAPPGSTVDEAAFRYPGPKPDTREAGILHLADKVEAACRAVKQPNPERFREVIQRLISDAMNDGQLEHCSLTLKELYTIGKAFAEVMVSIHHHRIEYPQAATDTGEVEPVPEKGVITLELLNPLGGEDEPEVLARGVAEDESVLPDDWEDESSFALPEPPPLADEGEE
ncbi:MAG: HDIG domain-containing metalloprotein [Pseudomonadota bacterium]